jgi:acyl-CoA dehydrogenase
VTDALVEARPTALPLWGDEHRALRTSARAFAERALGANIEQWERDEDFPRELFATVGAAGYFGLKFDERWGGSGPDFLAEAVWIQELARAAGGGVAADLGAHSQLAMLYVDRFGSDEQKEQYLRPGIAGTRTGALAVTEPDAGSDVAALTTRAVRDGDDWVLSGHKVFITNGAWSDWTVVAAKTDPDAGHGGITLFLVDADAPGFTRQRMKMLGWRTSHTGELTLDDVRVPASAVLGEEGRGFYGIMRNFAWERLSMSLGAVAAAERVLEGAIAYARERPAFGRPVARFQVWRHRFADLNTDLAVGRAITEHALRLYLSEAADETELVRTVAIAKLMTQRMAWRVADEAVQVHGGYGYMMEYPVQRWWRDTRLGPIGGGTDEIMKEIVAKTYGL